MKGNGGKTFDVYICISFRLHFYTSSTFLINLCAESWMIVWIALGVCNVQFLLWFLKCIWLQFIIEFFDFFLIEEQKFIFKCKGERTYTFMVEVFELMHKKSYFLYPRIILYCKWLKLNHFKLVIRTKFRFQSGFSIKN